MKEAKTELTSAAAVIDDGVDPQQVQQVNMRELLDMMMQSITSLAASLASSHSQPSDQLMLPGLSSPILLEPPRTPSRMSQLKTEEQEAAEAELLDQTEEEYDPRRPARSGRRSGDSLLEEYLRRTEAREAQRERDVDQRDDVTLFLLSLAPAIRRLPAEKQSWVRIKMQQFVHEAEFGPSNFQ